MFSKSLVRSKKSSGRLEREDAANSFLEQQRFRTFPKWNASSQVQKSASAADLYGTYVRKRALTQSVGLRRSGRLAPQLPVWAAKDTPQSHTNDDEDRRPGAPSSLQTNKSSPPIQRTLKVGSKVIAAKDIDGILQLMKDRYPSMSGFWGMKSEHKKRIKTTLEGMINSEDLTAGKDAGKPSYNFDSEEALLIDLATRSFTVEAAKLMSENIGFRQGQRSSVSEKYATVEMNKFGGTVTLIEDAAMLETLKKLMTSKKTELDCANSADLAIVYGLMQGLGEELYTKYIRHLRKGEDRLAISYVDLDIVSPEESLKRQPLPGSHVYIENLEYYQSVLDSDHIGSLAGQHGVMGSGGFYPLPGKSSTIEQVQSGMLYDLERRILWQYNDAVKELEELRERSASPGDYDRDIEEKELQVRKVLGEVARARKIGLGRKILDLDINRILERLKRPEGYDKEEVKEPEE